MIMPSVAAIAATYLALRLTQPGALVARVAAVETLPPLTMGGRLAALCRRVCGNDADGADATQEALLAIVRGLPRYDGRAAFDTWAYRVATNACLDELRRRTRRPVPGLEHLPEPASDHDPGDVAAASVDVDAALATLGPDFRAAVVLRDLCAFAVNSTIASAK